MRFENSGGMVLAIAMVCCVLAACSFNTEIKEFPKYVPNEPMNRVEATPEEIGRGKDAVEKFHRMLNAGEFDELFSWIDPKSQLSQDRVAFDIRMNRIKRELGSVERSDLQRYNVFEKSATKEIRLEYISKFTGDNDTRPRYELFYFELYPNGETKLLEYKNGIDNEKAY